MISCFDTDRRTLSSVFFIGTNLVVPCVLIIIELIKPNKIKKKIKELTSYSENNAEYDYFEERWSFEELRSKNR